MLSNLCRDKFPAAVLRVDNNICFVSEFINRDRQTNILEKNTWKYEL